MAVSSEGAVPAVPSDEMPPTEVLKVAAGAAALEAGAVRSIDEAVENEAPPLQEAKSRGRSIGSGLRLPSIFHRRTRVSRSMNSQEDDSDDEDYEVEKEPWCNFMRQHCGKGKGGCCYWCYVLFFFSFVFFFALFLKFMIASPMPLENWHFEYERFPPLTNQLWVQDPGAHHGYSIAMSSIPQTWSGCNHSCSRNFEGMISAEMNFHVEMSFTASNFEHTAYPVLLASNDFEKWWIASDRLDSTPTPFFTSTDAVEAPVYQYITDNCTRPPFDTESTESDTDSTDSEVNYASQPVYVMVCVTWRTESVNWHEQGDSQKMTKELIEQHCDAVGGVAGWPCASNPLADDLPGATGGIIDVDNEARTIAGVPLNASFEGKVALRACLDWPGDASDKE